MCHRDGDMVVNSPGTRARIGGDCVLSEDAVVIFSAGRDDWDTSGPLSDTVSGSHLYLTIRIHGNKSWIYKLTQSDALHPSPPQFLVVP